MTLLTGAQHALDLGGGARWVEEIPLYLIAVFRAENRKLFPLHLPLCS
jgi:hypothetical protein